MKTATKDEAPEKVETTFIRPKGLVNKLAWVRTQVDFIAKRGENKFHNYKYIMAGDVQGTIGSLLAQVGVIIHREPLSEPEYSIVDTRNGKENCCRMKVRYTFIDGEGQQTAVAEGSRYELLSYDTYGEGRDSGDKCLYKLYTGALKYVLIQAFCLGMGDDPEADEPTNRPERRREEPKETAPTEPKLLSDGELAVLSVLCDRARQLGGKVTLEALVAHYKLPDERHLNYDTVFNSLKEKIAKAEATLPQEPPKAAAPAEREPGDESEAEVPNP